MTILALILIGITVVAHLVIGFVITRILIHVTVMTPPLAIRVATLFFWPVMIIVGFIMITKHKERFVFT